MQVYLVKLDRKDSKVSTDSRDSLVNLAVLDVMGLKVALVLQVRKAMPVLKAREVSMVP